MSEHEITFLSGSETLAGTLTLPHGEGPSASCLLLNGSGPLDRNSNMPGQRLDLAKSLAVALAESGIATLRYDKRGVGESSGDFLATSFDDELADAGAALDLLRAHRCTTDRVTVVGHSVGATVAIRLVRHASPPDAYVLLAGAARTGERVMAWQSDRIAETRPVPLRRFMKRRQASDRRALLASTTPTLAIRGQTLPATWFRQYMAYDPTDDLTRIDRPVLALTGQKDLQVDVDDVERVARLVAGPFDGDTPIDLTHVFRSEPGPPSLGSYAEQLRRPPDAAALTAVARWIADRSHVSAVEQQT